MENQEKKHKRRVRYAGAYPKTIKRNTRSSTRKNMRIPYQG